MKVGIVIITYNISAEVFLLQIAAIKKFCKDDFVIHVIDNSDDKEIAEHIRYHSSVHGIDYTKTFSGSKGSSDSHAFAANFAYQKFKDSYPYFIFLDHDCIPVKEFSVVEALDGGHVAGGIGQNKSKKYPWVGCLYINNAAIDNDLVDFSPNAEHGLDTGGNLYKILEKYGAETFLDFNEAYHENPYFKDKNYGFYSMIKEDTFIHFVNGSGWNPISNNKERLSSLVNIVKEKTGL